MREAAIVSTARTPIGKAYRGAFNNTEEPTLGGHAIRHAVQRAGIDPGEVEDVIMGCAMQQGTQGLNLGRQAALAAGLPVTTAGMTVDAVREEYVALTPLGRLEEPKDVADAVVFLASDAARFITGEALNVTGGVRMD